MKILVACEESQAVCTAFRNRGHEAYSCDIQPCSGGHPEWHIMDDVTTVLSEDWDMVIAFPPCTHLAVSGAAHFAKKRADGRQRQGIDFFMQFTRLRCRWAIENPVGIMSRVYRRPDQIIQPWQFGHNTQKSTCLWLNWLPPLEPTCANMPQIKFHEWTNRNGVKKRQSQWFYETRLLPQKKRGAAASKTFRGIAEAMADQWGGENICDDLFSFGKIIVDYEVRQ